MNCTNFTKCKAIALCPVGHKCSGATQPEECPPGKYASAKGTVTCVSCVKGFFAPQPKSITCEQCPEGKKAPNETQSSCHECPIGESSPRGSTKCSKCAVGKYWNASICLDCPSGKYAATEGLQECSICDVGQFSDNGVSCKDSDTIGDAPVFTAVKSSHTNHLALTWTFPKTPPRLYLSGYLDDYRTSLRIPNSTFEVKDPMATSVDLVMDHINTHDIIYRIHFVIHYDNGTSPESTFNEPWKTTSDCNGDAFYLDTSSPVVHDWKCAACPTGASCKGAITWTGVKAKIGYWRQGRSFYKCMYPQACLGAANPALSGRIKEASIDHGESCNLLAGFKNASRLCASCQDNFVRGSKLGSCEQCNQDTDTWKLIGLSIAAMVFTVIFIKITVFKAPEVTFSDGVKKIALSYVQLAALAVNADVPWTKAFEDIFSFQASLTSVADALFSIECNVSASVWDVFQLKLGLILLFPILVIPIAYVCIRLRYDKVHFISTVVLMWYLVYPTIVSNIATLMACTETIDEVSYLQLDPEIPCWSGSHAVVCWSFGFLGILFYVLGMPLLAFFMMKRVKDLSSAKARIRYGILVDGYRIDFWWWELTVVARKIVTIVLSTFMEGVQQILTISLFLALLMLLTALYQPFVSRALLRLELASLALCFFTFWTGSMLITDPGSGESWLFDLAAWVVGCMNALGLLGLFYLFTKSLWYENGGAEKQAEMVQTFQKKWNRKHRTSKDPQLVSNPMMKGPQINPMYHLRRSSTFASRMHHDEGVELALRTLTEQ